MPFIIVSGSIGSGKSTLGAALAKAMNGHHLPEVADEYLFLSNFYQDMRRWAFHNQLQFVTHKFDQQQRALSTKHLVIQDGSAYESFGVFARKFHDDKLIGQREFQSMSNLYHLLADLIPPPDLLVHLTAPIDVLLNRIRSRGRHYERSIPPAYLEDLDARYHAWTSSFSLCPTLRIDTATKNFLTEEADVESVVQRVHDALGWKAVNRRYLDVAEADSRRTTRARPHARDAG